MFGKETSCLRPKYLRGEDGDRWEWGRGYIQGFWPLIWRKYRRREEFHCGKHGEVLPRLINPLISWEAAFHSRGEEGLSHIFHNDLEKPTVFSHFHKADELLKLIKTIEKTKCHS
jgi:hypothetical protein